MAAFRVHLAAAKGCGRWAGVGELYCREHKHAENGREIAWALRQVEARPCGTGEVPSSTPTEQGRAEAFRRLAYGFDLESLDRA